MLWLLLLPVALGVLVLRYLPALRFFRFLRGAETTILAGAAKMREEKHIPEAGLTVHVYNSADAVCTLVILPGMNPQGVHDPRAQGLAASFARAGFQVVAVDLVEFRNFQITNESVHAITSLLDALANHFPARTLQKVGVLAVCYAVGPAFLAAVREKPGQRVDFLISIGGYFQLQHAVEFAMTGVHDHNGFYQSSMREPWTVMIFAINHLEGLLPKSQDIDSLRESFLLRLNWKEEEARIKEETLSNSGKVFLNKVLQGGALGELGEFGSLLSRFEPEFQKLSPASILAEVRPDLRLYLLHGRGDSVVPCVETLELEAALRAKGHRAVRRLITNQLGHVDLSRPSSLADFLRFVHWTRLVLAETRI